MKTIYLDMDGVLTDFDGRMIALYGNDNTKRYTRENWMSFIQTKQFETLDILLSAYVLLDFVSKCGVNVEILSSSGGSEFHDEVVKQKTIWLQKHDIKYKPNIVSGGHKKAEFAKHNTLLVDDTEAVIDNFKKHGGQTILHDHRDVYTTLERIKRFVK